MDGILYLTDHENKKRFVQIDLDKFDGKHLEDLIDGLIAESRKDDEKISFEDFTIELQKEGLI